MSSSNMDLIPHVTEPAPWVDSLELKQPLLRKGRGNFIHLPLIYCGKWVLCIIYQHINLLPPAKSREIQPWHEIPLLSWDTFVKSKYPLSSLVLPPRSVVFILTVASPIVSTLFHFNPVKACHGDFPPVYLAELPTYTNRSIWISSLSQALNTLRLLC